MSAKINHVAIATDYYANNARFYEALFGMKTSSKPRPARAVPVSDGYVGLNCIPRREGRCSGLDHFGIEVDDIEETIARFQTTPVDPQRLADVKTRHRYSFLMNLDTPDRVAGALAYPIAVTGGIEAVSAIYATIDTITPDDILRAAKTYFVPERRTVVVLKGTKQ